jgi:excisionase family DNA binding protein
MRGFSFLEVSESELQTIIQQAVKDAVAAALNNTLPELIRPPTHETETYLTRQQVCDMLQISLPTLNTYTKEGIIKAKRIGRTIRYAKKDIYAAMEDVRNKKYKH